jgi:hypothetical protein
MEYQYRMNLARSSWGKTPASAWTSGFALVGKNGFGKLDW